MDWTGKRVLAPGFYDFFLEEIGKRPGNYMETGVFEGWGLRELALKYPDRMFYGVDPFIEDGYTTGHSGVEKGGSLETEKAIAKKNFNLQNTMLFEMSSDNISVPAASELGISFFFVDGKHDYETAISDLRLAVGCMANGGVIGIDDLGLPEVLRARDDFAKGLLERFDPESYDGFITTPGDLIYIKPL